LRQPSKEWDWGLEDWLLVFIVIVVVMFFLGFASATLFGQTAPTTYMADTSTTNKPQPAATNPGPANTVFTDPTFNTQILRVTDANTASGRSFVSTDAGNHRTFNSNNTRIKLSGPNGDGWWLEFNPSTFQVGTVPHSIPSQYAQNWEWSTVNPDIIYVLHGSKIATFNVTNGVTTDLGGPSDNSAVAYFANVVGRDNWVCAAAGPGQQDTWTRFYCLNVATPANSKYIDIAAKTVNGVAQTDTNWPTGSGPNGIHGMMGSTGDRWIQLTLRNPSWCGNGDTIFNLQTNTWQPIRGTNGCGTAGGGDIYWGGHTSVGQGINVNGAGNMAGNDSRGVLLRSADNTTSATYQFKGQPTSPFNGWCDAEHTSWLNSMTNPNAPIIQSRYISGCNYTWSNEIIGIATDNSNTVYRFAHNYNGCPGSYYSQAFAQVSNDGMFVLFSSWWGGQLGGGSGFDCNSGRIDTFMLKLVSGDAPPVIPVLAFTQQPTNTITGMALTPNLAGTLLPAAAHSLTLAVNSGNCSLSGTTTVMSNGSTGAWSFPGITVATASPPANCILSVTDTTNGSVAILLSNAFNVTAVPPVTITVSVASGNCQLMGPTMVQISGGVTGTFAFPGLTVTATNPPQTCTLQYTSSDGVTPPVISAPFTVLATAPPVPVLAFTQQPSETTTGLTILPTIAGTMTPGSVRSLSIGIDGSNCSLGGTTTVNSDSSGNWSFPGLTVSAVGLPATCWVNIRDNSTTNPAATIISMNFTVSDVVPPPPILANRIVVPRGLPR
jgi:hypothetical protein